MRSSSAESEVIDRHSRRFNPKPPTLRKIRPRGCIRRCPRQSVPRAVRYRHRRRGFRGLRAGQPAQCRSGAQRLPDRGRTARQFSADTHTGGAARHAADAAHELGLPHGAAGWTRRATRLPAARAHARRLELDERDDLHARPSKRLRRLGGAWQRRLVLLRRSAALSPIGRPAARRGSFPRRRRGAFRFGSREPGCCVTRIRRIRSARRSAVESRLQWRKSGRRGPLPGDTAPWTPLQRRCCLPASRARAAELDSADGAARNAHRY